jgi:hypothetical protein
VGLNGLFWLVGWLVGWLAGWFAVNVSVTGAGCEPAYE